MLAGGATSPIVSEFQYFSEEVALAKNAKAF